MKNALKYGEALINAILTGPGPDLNLEGRKTRRLCPNGSCLRRICNFPAGNTNSKNNFITVYRAKLGFPPNISAFYRRKVIFSEKNRKTATVYPKSPSAISRTLRSSTKYGAGLTILLARKAIFCTDFAVFAKYIANYAAKLRKKDAGRAGILGPVKKCNYRQPIG